MCLCGVLQVPVTVANVSALPKTGGCLESTVNVMTESVTNMMASYAQVITILTMTNCQDHYSERDT